MNILLWVLQVLAALLYGASGVMKVFMFDKVSDGVPSFGAMPREAWMTLGILELSWAQREGPQPRKNFMKAVEGLIGLSLGTTRVQDVRPGGPLDSVAVSVHLEEVIALCCRSAGPLVVGPGLDILESFRTENLYEMVDAVFRVEMNPNRFKVIGLTASRVQMYRAIRSHWASPRSASV